jgi:hypothetical protein
MLRYIQAAQYMKMQKMQYLQIQVKDFGSEILIQNHFSRIVPVINGNQCEISSTIKNLNICT